MFIVISRYKTTDYNSIIVTNSSINQLTITNFPLTLSKSNYSN